MIGTRFLIISLITLSGINAFAQNSELSDKKRAITKVSVRFMATSEYDSVFQKAFADLLKQNHIPSDIAQLRYSFQRHELWDATLPHLRKEFERVEYYNHTSIHAPAGSRDYEKVKKQYEKAFYLALRKVLYNNPGFYKWLNLDLSDRIAEFESHIEISEKGTYKVVENILIFNGDGESNTRYTEAGNEEVQTNTNNQIKRGIVRTFPTRYIGKWGIETHTSFKVKSVTRNGKSEPWSLRNHENGYQLFIGNQDVYLNNGLHQYQIQYETDQQLFQGKNYDECYWNVTGNGWDFVIEEASCVLKIPGNGKYLSERCYTGFAGSTNNDCISYFDSLAGTLTFKTTRKLLSGEGLTIAASFPKGFVASKTMVEKLVLFVANNKIAFVFPLVLFIALVVNFSLWLRFGKDKNSALVFPLFEPPPGYAPAALGFIQDQRFTDKLVAATLLDYGVNGYISIDVSKTSGLFKKDAYHIRENEYRRAKSTSYQHFMDEVGAPTDTVLIKGEYNPVMLRFSNDVKRYCEKNYIQQPKTLSGLFTLNNRYLIFGNLLGIAAGITVFVLLMLDNPPNPWMWLYGALGLVGYIILQSIFYRIMPAYNDAGKRLMPHIQGFVMYLKAAEEIVLNAMNPPEKTPSLYEKYLPFAVALGCESEWSEQFKDVLDTAMSQGGQTSNWYKSSFSSGISAGLGSALSGTISSASSPPSSGSGGSSFGGGSSGGGGGGGGGGGW